MNELQLIHELNFPTVPLPPKQKMPPPKEWQRTNLWSWRPSDFSKHNYGIPTGFRQDDGYLMVVDVDPKNNGDQTINTLQQGFGSLPRTFTVQTGSGGFHYYFISKKPWETVRYAGVDFQGLGAYVLGPGSIHPNGNTYLVVDDSELADMPDWFYEIPKEREKQKQRIIQSGEKVAIGGRDDWLTSQAGYLRRFGFAAKEIKEALKLVNRDQLAEPLPDKDLDRISASVERYEPTFRLEVVDQSFVPPKPREQSEVMAEAWSEASGLIKDIGENILYCAQREYPEFAMSAALSIVGAVAQATYLTPEVDWVPGSGMSLNTYSYNAHVSGGGKDVYQSAVAAYAIEIDQYLLLPEMASSHGLRSYLYAQNTAISVIDEIQDFLVRLDNRNNPHMYALGADLKKLTSSPKRFMGSIIKGMKHPDLLYPQLSIFGTGTSNGFEGQLSSNFIGGGLASRFAVWTVKDTSSIKTAPSSVEVPDSHVRRLREIYRQGMENSRVENDVPGKLGLYAGAKVGGNVESAPPCVPVFGTRKRPLDITTEANTAFIKFRGRMDAKFLSKRADDQTDSTGDGGSVYARAPQLALKYATLHAVGRGSHEVDVNDVRWGCKIADSLAENLVTMCGLRSADTAQERLFSKVLDTFKRKAPDWRPLSEVSKYIWKMKAKEFNEIAISLWLSDRIECLFQDRILHPNSDIRPEEISIPRGSKWRFKP